MYTLSIIPYLESCGNYTNIVTINSLPNGPLRPFVRRIQLPRLSPFQTNSRGGYDRLNCALGLVIPFTLENRLVTANDIPYLFEFLTNNGYIINTKITNMMNNSSIRLTNETILCFITYSPNH